MKVVIAPDSFKGSLSAVEASSVMEKGIKKAFPKAETVLVPVADGGEGTMDSLVAATGGHKVEVVVTGPLQEDVKAEYGILGDKETCVIEMASASGLILVEPEKRNPLITTTFGTGELLKKAMDDGYRKFILAIGGSATNDGGAGMLQALGMRLLDESGVPVGVGGAELERIATIDNGQFDSRIEKSEFLIASDVQNPFIGPNGASFVFGPQKGATPEMVELLDHNLTSWADVIEKTTGTRLHDEPGAGAAGGIGGAFQAFFPAQMERGIDIVIRYTNFEEKIQGASCVFTGEGQCDFQTASGKTPMGVAEAAKKQGIPVFVLAGSIGKGIEELYQHGITSVHSLMKGPMSLQDAMNESHELLESAAEQVMRTFNAIYKK
ncbi:glycerate kinase [Cytobacillus purgationiresistens]|uniref:Glycerate kinase n=1 Tax=Cytobacillus purgationiresistens TaxID=863449 RepID=A0ABU0AKW1_9BACI|nr:glycerate kinase [Cytobacillus purgationiresistens]MDQ0271900.1 glycerate kinase [Cytobacillus purgationiresistens]